MSDVVTLQNEIENLKTQLAQNSVGVNTLMSQLEAHKQCLNEALNVGINLRTNLILFQKSNKELQDALAVSKAQVDGLNQQLSDATKRIADLETPNVAPGQPVAA